jgi:hypothetical protein
MYGPFTHKEVQQHFQFFRTSPLGAVVNGNGSIQPIHDLSFPRKAPDTPSVNSYVQETDFKTTWDGFKVVASFFRQRKGPVKLAIFDWAKAYQQIPTAMSQWPYLMTLDFNVQRILDTRIALGGVASCGLFGRPADAWKQIMMKEFDLIMVFCWVNVNTYVCQRAQLPT